MVGPTSNKRKVLRQTDGERFVTKKKHWSFLRKLLTRKSRKCDRSIVLSCEEAELAIIYLPKLELFAFRFVIFK